jgi:hypothetical protein
VPPKPEWSEDEDEHHHRGGKKKATASEPAAAPAGPTLKMPPFSQRVVAVPMWPVTGGSEKSYVEFQRAQAELELWENGVLRERLTAEQDARRAALSATDPDAPPTMINNAIAGMVQRRVQRPQALRSEFVILPYSWSTIFN